MKKNIVFLIALCAMAARADEGFSSPPATAASIGAASTNALAATSNAFVAADAVVSNGVVALIPTNAAQIGGITSLTNGVTALGLNADCGTSGYNQTAVGQVTVARLGGTAVGAGAKATNSQNTAIGYYASAGNGIYNTAIGSGSQNATVNDGLTNTVEIGGGYATRNGFLHFRGNGFIDGSGNLYGNGSNLTGITAEQVGAVTPGQLASTSSTDRAYADALVSNLTSSIQYPVFNIPLDSWSEVELKASTNNFNPAITNAVNNLAYWYESLGVSLTQWSGFAHADLHAQLYYCNPDDTNYNGRSWLRATNSLTLTEQIGSNGNYQASVVIVPSLTVQDGSTNTWMRTDNDNLVWSFRRRTAAYGETNLLGRAIWHPIYPVQWRNAPMNVHF